MFCFDTFVEFDQVIQNTYRLEVAKKNTFFFFCPSE